MIYHSKSKNETTLIKDLPAYHINNIMKHFNYDKDDVALYTNTITKMLLNEIGGISPTDHKSILTLWTILFYKFKLKYNLDVRLSNSTAQNSDPAIGLNIILLLTNLAKSKIDVGVMKSVENELNSFIYFVNNLKKSQS